MELEAKTGLLRLSKVLILEFAKFKPDSLKKAFNEWHSYVDYSATWRVAEGYDILIKLLDFFTNEDNFVAFLCEIERSSAFLMHSTWHPFNRLMAADISAFRTWSDSLFRPLDEIAKAKGISVDDCIPKAVAVY